jgi:hypothetical protein
MSYGTYDNQSPLNQPFNPTANTGIGNNFGRVVGNAVADKLFGQNAQGPLSGLTRGLPGMVTNSVLNTVTNQTLPGAPSPEARRNVEQSQAGGGILKLRQPAAGPGGKSGGGKSYGGPGFGGGGNKYATTMPTIPAPEFDNEMPSVDYRDFQANLGPGFFNVNDVQDSQPYYNPGQYDEDAQAYTTTANNFNTGY